MKHTATLLCLLLLGLPLSIWAQTNSEKTSLESLIKSMSLEEKVGQMTNLTLATIVSKETPTGIVLDPAKVKDVLLTHHIGSLQNVVNHTYPIEQWHKLLDTLQRVTLKETRLKIPFLYCIDAVHGTNYTNGSVLFPHNLTLACSRNTELARQCAEITAIQTRASGIRYDFSPVLDVGRQPLWPRFPETFGEDVYLVSQMGTASIRGYEGTDLKSINSVAACMKHYVGYSVPQSGKDRAPAYIPEIQLREYFLPPFQAAVKNGAHTLMVNSAEVNGIPVHASRYLLTDVLRGELGFKGMIISDWEDVKKLVERHRVAENHKEAVYLAVNAGIDMCIVPFDFSFYDDLIALVREGRISEERINTSVMRILKLKQDLGLFEQPYLEKKAAAQFSNPAYSQTALKAARESIVLLKNEMNVLPLAPGKKIALTGPNAHSLTALHGAWSYTWQGTDSSFFSKETRTVWEALQKQYSAPGKVAYVPYQNKPWENASFKESDYIVVCLGEEAYAETPGNMTDLNLPETQRELLRSLATLGKPIILVLLEGRPLIIREIEPLCQAILFAGWPGSQGANALAEILLGQISPSGKLAFTYPRYANELLTYDHKWLDEAVEKVSPAYSYTYTFNPQFHFGQGLSYTTFEYSNFRLSKESLGTGDSLTINLTVKNTGLKAGEESIELYSRDLIASVTPSVKRLRKFTKISLGPGQSKEISFTLKTEDLAFVGQNLKWTTEPGGFELLVGKWIGKITVK